MFPASKGRVATAFFWCYAALVFIVVCDKVNAHFCLSWSVLSIRRNVLSRSRLQGAVSYFMFSVRNEHVIVLGLSRSNLSGTLLSDLGRRLPSV